MINRLDANICYSPAMWHAHLDRGKSDKFFVKLFLSPKPNGGLGYHETYLSGEECSAHHHCVDDMGSHTCGWSSRHSYHTLVWCEQTTIYSTYGGYQGPLATGHSLVGLRPDSLIWKESSALVSPDDTQERPGGVKKMTTQNLASHAIVYLTNTLTISHQSQLHLNFYVYLNVTLLSRGNAAAEAKAWWECCVGGRGSAASA